MLTSGSLHAAKTPRSAAGRKAARVQLRGQLSSVSAKIKNVRGKLRAAKRSESAIADELHDIQARLARTHAAQAAAQNRLARTRREQDRVAAALAASERRLKARERTLALRMAANYRQGPVRYASVVLGSRSMGEFVTRAHFVRTIVRYDATLIAQIKADREDVIRWKEQVDAKAREIGAIQQELAARQAELAQDAARQRAVLAEARERRAEFEDELDALQEDSERITKRLQALEDTPLGRARSLVPFQGGFILI